jgi:glycosyltransferase involved in cell wall biosynthesis
MSFWIAAIAAKCSGSALLFTTDAHSWDVREGPKWKAVLKRLIVPRIFAIADAVLAPSTATANYLRQMGVNERRIFLTPYVVENEFFARPADGSRFKLRRSWRVPDNAPVALCVAKLVPWKRPQDLLKAAAQVEGLHVVLAGSGSLRPELEALATEKNMSGRVHFLGFVNQSQLPAIYAASDFLVLPSEYEAFGVVVNEAFASGRPAIVSNACGAAGDLVAGRGTGFVFPVGDLDALQKSLRALSADARLATEMGNRARLRIGEWSPQANTEAFTEACLSLQLRRRHRPTTTFDQMSRRGHLGSESHAHE